ncbi:hypothetical protein [Arsenicicoccus sp. oral taxon 190]|uniref:hypothetical protein n=1 Tax=Arsenicicoccus sp. oral taxon 190 TaxID=1658671 RepID=UPI00067A2D9E|nr:hypothetical protein [Arsenicicoccus sp. oral taxon 190]AKT51811.1 hypothetical protein ADJ73_11935 [Arsenicicoccus sp. oral taxon 190]
MSVWRVEWLRLVRTPRLVSLLVVFTFLGLAQPVFVRFGPQLLERMGGSGGARVQLPPPSVEQALPAYLGQAGGLGMLVAAGITVAACAVDARYSLSVYYRTRSSLVAQLVPRLVVNAAAAVAAFTLGLGAAAYETAVLIAPVGPAALARCWAAGAAFLTLACAGALVAAVLSRSVLAGFACVAGTFMVLVPLLGTVPALRPWVPTAAPAGLLDALPWRPAVVALTLAAALVATGLLVARRKPLPRH